MNFYGSEENSNAAHMASKGTLLLVVVPAVLAFAFAAAVFVSMLPDIDDRLYQIYGYPHLKRTIVGGSGNGGQ